MTTDVTPPVAPVPAIPPRKRSLLVRLGLGCLSVIVLGCVGIGAVVLYQNRVQEQNYQTGHAAYMQADCATASDPLRKAATGDPGSATNDVARKAQAELQACEALTAADTLSQQGKAGNALLAYSGVVATYENTPLKDAARAKGQALLTTGAMQDVATVDVCQSIDTLQQQVIATPDATLPPLLYACGQTYEQTDDYTSALVFYDRFRSEYSEHELAGDVQRAFVHATLAEAAASGAGALPAPEVVSDSNTANGQVVVVIQNDSPEPLNLVFSGPDTRVEALEACTDCEKFSDDEPSSCPEKGPIGRYELTPGDYDVVVKTGSGRNVTPFRGTWSLNDGEEYSSCFYVVTHS